MESSLDVKSPKQIKDHQYYITHRQERLKYNKKYAREHREARNTSSRHYRQQHPEATRKSHKKWLEKNSVYMEQWYEKNNKRLKQASKERARKWQIGNPQGTIYLKSPKRDYPKDGRCEVCKRKDHRLVYHHWDDKNPSLGIWVCAFRCHGLGEATDIGTKQSQYIKAKKRIIKESKTTSSKTL